MRAVVIHHPDRLAYSVHIVTRGESGLEAMDCNAVWQRVAEGHELPAALTMTEHEMATIMIREVIMRDADRMADA